MPSPRIEQAGSAVTSAETNLCRENLVGRIERGQRAVNTPMSQPDLLPTASPAFDWIRLAQRVPARTHLEKVPDGAALQVGTSASVRVMTNDGDPGQTPPVPAVPR